MVDGFVDVLALWDPPPHDGLTWLWCRWRLPVAMREAAGDEPVRLASHLRDAAGALLDWDGPRSLAVPPTAGEVQVVVPVALPRAPGVYQIELDPVVEARCWGSSLGLPPKTVLAERLATGDVRVAGVDEDRVQAVDARVSTRLRARWRELGDLRAFEWRTSSQHGEDGILAELLRRVGATHRFLVEFGASDGAECCGARLIQQEGWGGLLMEGDAALHAALAARFADRPRVRCVQAWVSAANIEGLLAEHAVPRDFDLLTIDIDGNDYWVWRAIDGWRPRVVAIEYNPAYPPPRRWVMRENPAHRWDGTDYHGASLTSLTALGSEKGYTLVGTTSNGVNAFFVRDDLYDPRQFLDPVVAYHYSPPRHGLHGGGHPPGSGPFEER